MKNSLVCFQTLTFSLPSQGLYCDIRQLVQFIKEAHGNVFRRVALSALLDSAEKVATTKKPDERDESKHLGPRRYWPMNSIVFPLITEKSDCVTNK